MDMDIVVVEDAVVYAEGVIVCLAVFEGQHRRLLHHVAEVSCQRQLSALSF